MVVKRDGTRVVFDRSRIEDAVYKAFCAVAQHNETSSRQYAETVTEDVTNNLPSLDRDVAVEDIQDAVEQALMRQGHHKEARAYIVYREQRSTSRDFNRMFVQVDRLADSYLGQADWRISENANVTFSLQGLNNYLADALTARYWMHILPAEAAEAHREGIMHIHDLGIFAPYCCGWDLKQLLDEGFGGVPGKVQSRPPLHLRTALGQAVNFIFTLQGESAGAQAFSNFDTLLAPFVREDGLSYRQVKQAMQEFVYNMNVATRVGGQSPFSNITLDVTVPVTFSDEYASIGGKLLSYKYSTLQAEMDMINRALAEVLVEGDASGRPFTFPIPTYNIWGGTDYEHERWGPIWKMAAETGLPYFANFVNSDMRPEDVRSMCCRLRLNHDEMKRRLGGLFGSTPLTGSVGVVTINLARAALMAGSDVGAYLENLRQAVALAESALVARRKIVDDMTRAGLYPYSRHYLQGVKEQNGSYWSQHFLTIGLCGAHEAAMELFGKGIESVEGYELASTTLDFLREQVDALNAKYGEEHYMFNLEATPAEGASFRLAKADAERYPASYAAQSGGMPYTGSTLQPVDSELSLFDALTFQAELQTKYTGGTVFHAYMGQPLTSPDQARHLVSYMCSNFRLPYLTLSPVYSICPTHGRMPGEHETCPTCGSDCEVWSRIVGYYRPVSQWSAGKQKEHEARVYYEPEGVLSQT